MSFKIYPDQSKNYWDAAAALKDLKYEYVGDYRIGRKKRNVFKHTEQGLVYYLRMDHFNATIFFITLQKLPKSLNEYKEWQQGW